MNPLRRFSEALRELRWTQVVLELALLITGILIALAVDGWIDDRRAERALLIRDRNNQMFVDQMYMPYLLDSALVAPRPSRNLPVVSANDRAFASRVGAAVGAGDDRLWQLSPDAREWNVLAGKVWYRGLASQAALDQSRQLEQDVRAVRELVAGELARRWPQ